MNEIDDLEASQAEPLLTNETYFDFTDEDKRFRRLRDDMPSYRELALEAAGGWNICETLSNFYMYCISGTYLQYMAKSVSFFNIYHLPELAYWSIALSVTIKEGNIDNSWWDRLDTLYKSKTYFYNNLTTMEKKRDIYDENTRDAVLNTIRIVLKSMEPFVDNLPEFCRSSSYICSK